MAKIISAFPCCGKSYFVNHNTKYHCIELDSSIYSWMVINGTKIRNPDFPENYIEQIKTHLFSFDVIFISSHVSVRTALRYSKLPYILVYPNNTPECFEEWKRRAYSRGSMALWDTVLGPCWTHFLHSCKGDTGASIHYRLQSDEYIDAVVRMEVGDVD